MLAFLLAAALTVSAQAEPSWTVDETAHFSIHHENPGSALGDYNRIERIYEALHTDLWSLVPWMSQKKVPIYIYSGRDSYLKSRFKPPSWSAGLMSDSDGEKVLALYEPLDTAIVAHELTHLYFHAFFDEKPAQPPAWLDEGLAAMLQDEALTMPDSRYLGPVLHSPLPLKTLMKTRPASDSPGARVTLWYLQSHSIVRFIKRAHIEGSFAVFCQKIRDGEDLEAALRGVYGYQDMDAFEQAWLRWRPRKAVGLPVGLEGQ